MIVDRNDLPGNAPELFVMVSVIPEQNTQYYITMGYGVLQLHSEEVEGVWQHWFEVFRKNSNVSLIRFDIRRESRIELQHETIIVVEDRQAQAFKDFAISCAEVSESDYIWRWICEKTGKDYLEIKEGEVLEMPTPLNLARLLTTVQERHDLVFYHIRNSPLFMPTLQAVWTEAEQSGSAFHLRQLASILNHLLRKMEQRNVCGLFGRGNFELLLRLKTYERKIDYLRLWRERQVIRSLLPVGEHPAQRIHEYHAILFYREFLLDFKTDHFLNHILESEISDCCKDIAHYLTTSTLIDELIDLPALPLPAPTATEKIEIEEETFAPEAEALRRKQLAERKVEFLLEALSINKSVKESSVRCCLYQRMLSSRVMGALGQFLDQNVLKTLEVLATLAKVYPVRFLDQAKRNYREGVEDCYRKMVNKFSFVSEDWQLTILSVFRSLGESLLTDNSNFVIESFVVTNIEKYRDERSILLLLAELLDFFETFKIFSQAMQSRLFVYLGQFLTSIASARPDHHIALRVTKIMKKVVAESARSTICAPYLPILQQINYQVVQHGFFAFFMLTYHRNAARNNIVLSNALIVFKMLASFKTQTRYHRYVLKKHRGNSLLEKYFPDIMAPPPLTPGLLPLNERRDSRIEMHDECLELMQRESKENRAENGQPQKQEQQEKIAIKQEKIAIKQEKVVIKQEVMAIKQEVEVIKEVEMVEENEPTFREALDLAMPAVQVALPTQTVEVMEPIEPIELFGDNQSIFPFEPYQPVEPIQPFQPIEVMPFQVGEPIPAFQQIQQIQAFPAFEPIEPIEHPTEKAEEMNPPQNSQPTKRRKHSNDESNPLPVPILLDYDEPQGNK